MAIMTALVFALSPIIEAMAAAEEWLVFVGTYTGSASRGIYAHRFDAGSGRLSPLGLAAEASNPSFLVVHPSGRHLYAVGEDNAGTISAFSVEPQGKLRLVNTVSSRGDGPCHSSLDRTGRWLFVANYGSGSVALLPVREDGSLGEAEGFAQHRGSGSSSADGQRQAAPHAHSVNVSPDNRYLLVNDLGLDETLVYRFDATLGSLIAHNPAALKSAPGSGPRHLTFSPDGRFIWVFQELNATVTAIGYNKTSGALTPLQTLSALPDGFTGSKSGAEIEVDPNGRFVYGSIRGPDSIAAFSVDRRTGLLRFESSTPSGGKTPRSFAIDPSGAYLLAANQDSDNVAIFRIDVATGALGAAGEPVGSPVPVSIVFVPVP